MMFKFNEGLQFVLQVGVQQPWPQLNAGAGKQVFILLELIFQLVPTYTLQGLLELFTLFG